MGFTKNVLTLLVAPLVMAILTSAQTSYNSNTYLCCNGTVTEITGKFTSTACCGNVAYDYITQVCCSNNQVFDRPENSTDYYCCQDYETGADATGLYNYKTEVCCNGVVSDKPNADLYYGCCSGQPFDWNTQLCCNQTVLDRELDQECCGEEQLYNTKTQVCCAAYGQISENKWGVKEVALHDKESNTDSCCGVQKYDYTEAVCCNDQVKQKESSSQTFGGCCNGEPYDYTDQVCCTTWGEISPGEYGALESKLHQKESDYDSCCGLETYDYRDEVCCNQNTTRSKPEGSDKNSWMQCCGEDVITDYQTQFCVDDRIVDRNNPTSWFCGDQEFDSQTQFCCANEVYDKESDMQCCHLIQLTYNTTTHQCCFDKIIPLTEDDQNAGNDACCVAHNYNHDMHHYGGKHQYAAGGK